MSVPVSRAEGAERPACHDTARSAGAGQGGGLVPSKTSQVDRPTTVGDSLLLSFGASVLAEKRVARLKRSVWAAGHLHKLADKGHRPPVCWFVTMTYEGVDDWASDHISASVERFRQWCRRAGVPCRYTWVAELQARGAVHYHLLAWLPVGVRMPHWDTAVGKRPAMWAHGMTNTQEARSGVGYLMKYLSKLGEFHRFPKGLRLYGIGGLDATGKACRQWFNLPAWAKCLGGVGDIKRYACGLVVQATGELLRSPWTVSLVPGGMRLCLVAPLPARFHDGAYSSVRFS